MATPRVGWAELSSQGGSIIITSKLLPLMLFICLEKFLKSKFLTFAFIGMQYSGIRFSADLIFYLKKSFWLSPQWRAKYWSYKIFYNISSYSRRFTNSFTDVFALHIKFSNPELFFGLNFVNLESLLGSISSIDN